MLILYPQPQSCILLTWFSFPLWVDLHHFYVCLVWPRCLQFCWDCLWVVSLYRDDKGKGQTLPWFISSLLHAGRGWFCGWVTHNAKQRRDFLRIEALRLRYALHDRNPVLSISFKVLYFFRWFHKRFCIPVLCVWQFSFVNAAYPLENFLVSCGVPLNSHSRITGLLKMYSKHPLLLKQSLGYISSTLEYW